MTNKKCINLRPVVEIEAVGRDCDFVGFGQKKDRLNCIFGLFGAK